MEMTEVQGQDRGNVVLYALSTCGWCRKTKALLGDLGVAYRYIDVDLLSVADQHLVMDEISVFNPSGNFPTLIIDGEKCIIGFKEAEIKEAFAG